MEKLNLKRDESDFYRIEVNDKGEYIEFDLTDLKLPEKILTASDDIRNTNDELDNKILEIEKEYNDKDNIEKTRAIIKIRHEYSKKMREIYDSFLGKGACQKIFGDKEVFQQYIDLLIALQEHFDKMELQIGKIKKRIVEKYKIDVAKEDVL